MMDDYKLLHMISEGPLGPSLLVEHRSSGEKCVVKKVECCDHTQAILAYHQALELEQLNSCPSVCHYYHFFVHWDREAHAMYLCTVSPYQELGNLGEFIARQRKEKQTIKEELLKSWAMQLVWGVGHAHNQGLLHRNIKPSNIFLSSPTSLLLGDFTVPVVMENLREAVSKRGGSLQWLAPEEMEKKGGEQGSEKADVWSLGCVLLQLATCSFMDASDCSALLQRLHRDPSVLEEVLEKIKEVYSGDVCQLVESCLRRSIERRPSISDLVKYQALQQEATDSTSDSGHYDPEDNDAHTEPDLNTERTKEECSGVKAVVAKRRASGGTEENNSKGVPLPPPQ